jgi:hypothetical protein
MQDLKCPFRRVLLPGDFGCRHATVVTRREGPDIACDAPETNALCGEVLERLKDVGLPALGYVDDLTQLPHGAAMKVQMGGLLGLGRVTDQADTAGVVQDVGALVEAAVDRFGGTAAIPYGDLVAEMERFQLKRRRAR